MNRRRSNAKTGLKLHSDVKLAGSTASGKRAHAPQRILPPWRADSWGFVGDASEGERASQA